MPIAVNGGLCNGEVTLTVSVPAPVLPIVTLAEAVAPGLALKLNFFLLTEICPGAGDGLGVAVAVRVAVAVCVAVTVAVLVAVTVAVAVAVAVLVAVAVRVGVAVRVAVAVAVRVGVAVRVAVALAVAVGVLDDTAWSKISTRLLPESAMYSDWLESSPSP